jgi:hypothetical protein
MMKKETIQKTGAGLGPTPEVLKFCDFDDKVRGEEGGGEGGREGEEGGEKRGQKGERKRRSRARRRREDRWGEE